MIATVIGVLITILSLMVAFFLSIGNVHHLVEADFLNKAQSNAVLNTLQVGQLRYRDKTLNDTQTTHNGSIGSLRSVANKDYSNVTYQIRLEDSSNITVNVTIK